MSNFCLSPDIVLRSEPQYYRTHIAFDINSVRTEFLTEKEFKVLDYIKTNNAEIKEISEKFGIDFERCEKFLKNMVNLGFVQLNSRNSEYNFPKRIIVNSKKYRNFNIPFLSAPTTVDLFITKRCNLECVHCFARKDKDDTHELSLEELQNIFNKLERMGVLELRINGGEPLTHPDIEKILIFLKDKKFRKVILTNGILLNKTISKLLRDSKIIPTISLDGSTSKEHDLFRGKEGSFNQTIDALKLLQEKRTEYGINCCIHKKNIKKVEDIIKLAIKLGAYRIAFLDLKNVGKMRGNTSWIPLYSEYKNIIYKLKIYQIKYRGKIDVSSDVFLHCKPLRESIFEANRGYISCKAGINRMIIDSDASVYPCNLVIGEKKWLMGNLREENLTNIWFSPKWLFFRGGIKKSDLIQCKECKKIKECEDFYCRLLPYITNGSLYGPNPKCK